MHISVFQHLRGAISISEIRNPDTIDYVFYWGWATQVDILAEFCSILGISKQILEELIVLC